MMPPGGESTFSDHTLGNNAATFSKRLWILIDELTTGSCEATAGTFKQQNEQPLWENPLRVLCKQRKDHTLMKASG